VAGVEPQNAHTAGQRGGLELVQQRRPDPLAARLRPDEHPGDLPGAVPEQAEPAATEGGTAPPRHEQHGEVVAGIVVHRGIDLARGHRPAEVPARDIVEVGTEQLAGRSRRRCYGADGEGGHGRSVRRRAP